MDYQNSVKLLDIYIDNAWRIFNSGFGCDRAEGAMFAAIDLLREQEALRGHFLDRVRLTLNTVDGWGAEAGGTPLELIQLATHELQWPEFREIANNRHKVFERDVLHKSVLLAFEKDWEDREFYQRYRRKLQGSST